MVAWAVPSSFPLLAIFKTWDSFRAGQWPSDRSSLACRLPAPHHRGVQEPALPPSLIGFLPGPCCGPVGWGSRSSCGPTPYSPITCSSLQTTLGPNSRSHLFTPSVVQRCPPPPVHSPCSRHLSESPGTGEAGYGLGPHWAQAGRAERGSWMVGWQVFPHRGLGSRRKRWRSPLWEETQKAFKEAGQPGQESSSGLNHTLWTPSPSGFWPSTWTLAGRLLVLLSALGAVLLSI